jgi:SAM-dependent methyltransferase
MEYFNHVRSEILPLLPTTARRILDVGCGSGATAAWVKTLYPTAHVIGLEGNPALLPALERNVDEAYIVDLNQPLPHVGEPDLVLLLDILEHLLEPETLLSEIVALIPNHGTVIISLPNVAHLSVAGPLFLFGRFDRTDAGILDRTHLHFYYRDSIVSMINRAGLELLSVVRNGIALPGAGLRSLLMHWLTFGALKDRLTKQYVISAMKIRDINAEFKIKEVHSNEREPVG